MQQASNGDILGRTSGTLGLLLDVEVPLVVRFGTTRMFLGDLARLTAGSVVEFANSPNRCVDLLVNGRVVARGEAVVVNGNYGIRLSEVLDR